MILITLRSFESQLVLLPVVMVVIVGLFALVITDLEVVIRRRLREDDPGATVVRLPRRRPRAQHQLPLRELERELFDRATHAEAGER